MEAEVVSVVAAAFDVIVRSKARVRDTGRLLSESRDRVATSRRHLNPAFALAGASDDSLWEQQPARAGGAILAKLVEGNGDHIILGGGTKVYLRPTLRCDFPPGTPLLIVYAESEGRKVAVRIERSRLTW